MRRGGCLRRQAGHARHRVYSSAASWHRVVFMSLTKDVLIVCPRLRCDRRITLLTANGKLRAGEDV